MDLQYFASTLPSIPNIDLIAEQIERDGISFTTDDAILAWCEHDALHHISGHPFTKEGEEHIVYLEQVFQKGWFPLGSKYNTHNPEPCECDMITPELIDETAQMLKELIY